jgi:hypothetical protein
VRTSIVCNGWIACTPVRKSRVLLADVPEMPTKEVSSQNRMRVSCGISCIVQDAKEEYRWISGIDVKIGD